MEAWKDVAQFNLFPTSFPHLHFKYRNIYNICIIKHNIMSSLVFLDLVPSRNSFSFVWGKPSSLHTHSTCLFFCMFKPQFHATNELFGGEWFHAISVQVLKLWDSVWVFTCLQCSLAIKVSRSSEAVLSLMSDGYQQSYFAFTESEEEVTDGMTSTHMGKKTAQCINKEWEHSWTKDYILSCQY